MNRMLVGVCCLLCLVQSVRAQDAIPKPSTAGANPVHSAVTPVPRSDAWWVQRHEAMNARAKQGGVDLVLIGDSITQGWEGAGKEVWEKYFAPLNAMNLGIGGDRTQHVLWRLDHGNLDGIAPKAAVIMIGTNNADTNTAAEIADGIKAIVGRLRAKLPGTKVLVLGVFPRGEKPNPLREKLDKVNVLASKLDDGAMVQYLDIGAKFLQNDATISQEIMPDFLHLSPRGYQIWADSVGHSVAEMVGVKSLPATTIAPAKPAPGQKPPVTLKVGDAAPALAVDSFIKGTEVKALQPGTIYVVEFWATWCGPCIESIPHLTELQHKYPEAVFIGVAASERKPAEGAQDKRLEGVKSIVAKQGDKMGYRVAYDSKRAMSNTWMVPAGQGTIPCAFIVDAQGKIAFIGHPDDMEAPLAKIASGK